MIHRREDERFLIVAAGLYWKTWAAIPVRFARRDARRVPEEWGSFGNRISPLTSSPRKAPTPANAILNYLYALLEAETRVAVLTMGLDPGVGILHADQDGRDSLVCDLMEPVRPHVDTWLYSLLKERQFSRTDFFETPEGQIELGKPIANKLAATMPLWAKAVAPVVESIASCFRPSELPAKLTEAKRSRKGRGFAKARALQAARLVEAVPRSCLQCGSPVRNGSRFCSTNCSGQYTAEVTQPRFEAAGVSRLRTLRTLDRDPTHGGLAATKRGKSNIRRARQRTEWLSAGSGTVEEECKRFLEEIKPALADIPVSRIAQATGLSLRYVSLIRRGARVPHPVHHAAFRRLVESWVT